ncbi:hypothetical protein MFIFM68171_00120 [Madurella fahalii]|uniref:Heterokaryon incompatibility domain-containing protein n=1 Tax=Madurella fahalii TaxID=1157608 RepID=A0ABQ0FWP0_9PEZI
MVFGWRSYYRAIHFRSLPFGIDRWILGLSQGWKITFGFYAKFTNDDPGLPPTSFSGGRYLGYMPLDPARKEIRLLKIHAGRSEEAIHTSIRTVSLVDSPEFEALSYVWGCPKDEEVIFIDGQRVKIGRNLFEAIHTLRLTTSDRILWVDAVCIWQDNVTERGHQVGMMDQIYRLAENVAVYLGPPTAATPTAIRTLRYFTDCELDPDNGPWRSTPIEEIEQSLTDIIHRPWFTRIWTVQEATLARHITLISGEHEVSWVVDLRTVKSILFRIKSAVISPGWSMPLRNRASSLDWSRLLNILDTRMRQAARREGAAIVGTPLDLAFDFRSRLSADPRDKYFAIANIIENDQGGSIVLRPDYDMTLEELHQRFTDEVRRVNGL